MPDTPPASNRRDSPQLNYKAGTGQKSKPLPPVPTPTLKLFVHASHSPRSNPTRSLIIYVINIQIVKKGAHLPCSSSLIPPGTACRAHDPSNNMGMWTLVSASTDVPMNIREGEELVPVPQQCVAEADFSPVGASPGSCSVRLIPSHSFPSVTTFFPLFYPSIIFLR